MTKNKKRFSSFFNQKGFTHVELIIAIVFISVIAIVGYRVFSMSRAATSCTVSPILVNSCHPLFGTAVGGDPRAPGGASSSYVTQFNYAETLMGRKLDLFHDDIPAGNAPLNSNELTLAKTTGVTDFIDWIPTTKWADGDGGDPAVNALIKKGADSFVALAKSNPGVKVFLAPMHEPEDKVSGGGPSAQQCASENLPAIQYKGSDGTPAQLIGLYKNMRTIVDQEFNNANLPSNVVWVMDYQGSAKWDCLIPALWPGNSVVDWVGFDIYGGSNYAGAVGQAYNFLKSTSNSTHDYAAKPWGSVEFGDCNNNGAEAAAYYDGVKKAVDNNTFPNIKLYMLFDDANGPGDTSSCLIDHSAGEIAAVKSLANDPVFTSGTPSKNPTINSFSAKPITLNLGATSELSWSTSNVKDCSVTPGGPQNTTATSWTTPALATTGGHTYTLSCQGTSGGTSASTSVTVTVSSTPSGDKTPPTVSITRPSSNATVSGTVVIGVNASDNVGVTRTHVVWDKTNVIRDATSIDSYGWGSQWDTTKAPDGKHTVSVTVYDAAGNSSTASITVNVHNGTISVPPRQ